MTDKPKSTFARRVRTSKPRDKRYDIRDEAGLPGLRLHDLRHTWASVAAMNGVDMVTIAKLLGHALVETTERYVYLADRSVTEAADWVSNRIGAALDGKVHNDERGSGHAQG